MPVLHHVNDEREKMFPRGARKAQGMDLMGQARKAELMAAQPE